MISNYQSIQCFWKYYVAEHFIFRSTQKRGQQKLVLKIDQSTVSHFHFSGKINQVTCWLTWYEIQKYVKKIMDEYTAVVQHKKKYLNPKVKY